MNLRTLFWLTVLIPLAFLGVTEYIRHFAYPALLHSWPGYLLTVGVMALGVLVFSYSVFRTIEAMEKKILKQNRELSVLNAIGQVVSESLDLKEVLARALDRVLEVMGVEAGGIYLMDEETAELTLMTHRGVSPEFANRVSRLKPGEGFTGRVAQAGEPLVVEDVAEYPGSMHVLAQQAGVRSLASVPLKAKDRVLGVMTVASHGQRHFDPGEVELLTAIGQQIGVALENARLHDKVQRTSSYLQTIIESSGQAIIAVDLQGRILLWNRGAETIYGWSKAEALGSVLPMVPEWERAEAPRTMARMVQTGETVYNVEVQRLRKDGTLIPVMVTGAPIRDTDGHIVGIVGISTDMTDKKRLDEELLRQKQSLAVMEERERIGMDLHDGVIQSLYAVGLNLEDSVELVQEAPGEVRQRIGEAVETLNGVIRDIRSYIFDLQPRLVEGRSFDQVLAELIREVKVNALVETTLTVDGEGHQTLSQEQAQQLFHIAQEALTNVIKHARATTVTARLSSSDGRLVLSIADNGVGFDLAQAECGTGYGLRNMAERASALGGTLLVESACGKGTQIKVEVPLERQGET